MEVRLEGRRCPNCDRMFRVMVESQQEYCGKLCEEYGTRAHGERLRGLREKEKATEKVVVDVGTELKKRPMLPAVNITDPSPLPPWPRKGKNQGTGTIKSEKKEMSTEKSGGPSTEAETENTKEITIIETEQKGLSKSMKDETKGTLQEYSAGSLPSIELASLDILNLSKRSANRLMKLMEASVTDKDLEKQGVNPDRIKTAVECANALTQVVQTNINLIKALGKK